jgi:hypothetical protein
MKLIINESQYRKVLLEYYQQDKLYSREVIVKRLQSGPQYMKKYIKNLPYIECRDQNDEKRVCTQIPEVVYMYLFGNF